MTYVDLKVDNNTSIKVYTSYYGTNPVNGKSNNNGIYPNQVFIEKNRILNGLVDKARKLRDENFDNKLKYLKQLVKGALKWKGDSHPIVFSGYPLKDALDCGVGCCRYYSALLFILGYEAHLGEAHYIQVGGESFTAFNEIVDEGRRTHKVCILKELQEEQKDYVKTSYWENMFNETNNISIYSKLMEKLGNIGIFSYHHIGDKWVIISVGMYNLTHPNNNQKLENIINKIRDSGILNNIKDSE